MTEKKMWIQNELTCKPLDSYEEILEFIQNPPSWRLLCKELKPHSENLIKNIDICKSFGTVLLESPQTFCHYPPEAEEVKRHKGNSLPKTLVCHDMANGYHDDSYIDGTGKYDAYTFYNWAAVDIFCYFSHHLITIPPLGWINVAHAHGVKVIGTIITEWAEGVAFWDKILDSQVEWQNFASALVAIAKTLKFDGWLLNIENKISNPDVLVEFVQHLHTVLHQELPDPVLVWYDSVTIDGHLHWQNGLNAKNKKFFDIVDGFFTNYSWTMEDVQRSAAEARDRLTDLYIGIDVWGRNFHGGGHFNTQQAVKVAYNYGCSLAFFAPAWTHEAMSEHPIDMGSESEPLEPFDQFLLRDRALWGSLWPYLNTKLPSELPFQTSFCRGQGKKRRLYGEVIAPVPWFNLRHMQYQLNSNHGPHGYVLSSIENLTHMYHILKQKDGILHYRRSIEMLLNNIDTKDISTKSVNITAVLEESDDIVEDDERQTVKRKIKTAIRHLFNIKNPKTDEHIEVEQTSSNDNELESTSMVQLSINIGLGDKTGKVRYNLAYVGNELECLEPFYEDSFLGGSCLKVNPKDDLSSEHRLSRIFHCDFSCDKIIACVVTKNMVGHECQFLNIQVRLQDNNRNIEVVLVGRNVPHELESADVSAVVNEYPRNENDPEFRELQKYILLNEPSFYIPVQNAYGWKIRYYEFDVAGASITSVSCRTGMEEGPILLGYFGLCQRTA